MKEMKDYEKAVNECVNELLFLNEITSTSGIITGGIFSGLNSIAEYINRLAKINNLEGTIEKKLTSVRYFVKGKKFDIDNFNVGMKSIA
jgi:hypothetical protein